MLRLRPFAGTLGALVLAAGCALPPAGPPPAGPRLEYRLRYDPQAADPVWDVELLASGLAEARALVLELEDWGEWLRLDGYYLRALAAEPPLRRGAARNTFELCPPPGWDGRLRVRYQLTLAELDSPAREQFGALPYRAPSYAFGVSANVLLAVRGEGLAEPLERSLQVEVPPDWWIATGYGGLHRPGERIAMPPSIGNTALACGRPLATAVEPGLEIVQWGGREPVVAPLAAFARRYLAACNASTGVPLTEAIRLVVTEPGAGGTRLDGAIAIGCPESLNAAADPYTLHFLAHEVYHEWLGGRLRAAGGGEQLCWFWEGFTDYLALWNLAHAGLVSREWFARRLQDYATNLAGNPHWGQVAYADPDVPWRDPEVEPLAYGGSALLAFALDVELRAAGRPGLSALIHDLSARDGGRYTLDSLRAWVEAQGLAAFWQARVLAPCSSRVDEELRAIGFAPSAHEAPFAYVGLRLDRVGPFGTVVAVDPAGPAQGTVFPGDVVTGLTPTHAAEPPAEELAPEFPFGLDYYDASAARVRLDVVRAGERIELWLTPKLLRGRSNVLQPQPACDAFFAAP